MNDKKHPSVGMNCVCPLSRRSFLKSCATCAGGMTGLGLLGRTRAVGAGPTSKPKIRLVYAYVPSTTPIWPNIGYDFDKRKKELTAKLTAACPNIQFLPVTVQSPEQAKQMLEADAQADGYLVCILGIWSGAVGPITAKGRPTILVDDLFAGSGEFLISNAAARRAGLKVVGVSSSCFDDVAGAARCFELLKTPDRTVDDFMTAANAVWKKNIKRLADMTCKEDVVRPYDPAECVKKLKKSKILMVGNKHDAYRTAIQSIFGPEVLYIDFQELHDAYTQADRDEAAQWADRWIKAAEKVIEPSRDEIVRSGAMYLAERALLSKYDAQAITINCLGGFYGGHIKAYPCLGFSQLNNDGLVGACEADLPSTITMLTMAHLVGRPGYISDPVIDTSKNEIIYAHCVAPTKVFGTDGPSNPYHIRDHSEDRHGAAIRSLLPLGYMTTTIKFEPLRKQVILHQGKSVENVDEDKACRTKLAVAVKGDIDRLMCEWDQWSWHRVTFYGDLKEPVAQMAEALGMPVVHEA